LASGAPAETLIAGLYSNTRDNTRQITVRTDAMEIVLMFLKCSLKIKPGKRIYEEGSQIDKTST
jgi:hypothetical protein